MSNKNTVKDSTYKLSDKPMPGDKHLGIDLDIHLYKIEDSDKTKEGEYA